MYLCFLGYWLTQKTNHHDLASDWEKHLARWSTKANFAHNVIWALTQRTKEGLPPYFAARLLHSICRSVLWYGLKFWGGYERLAAKADAFRLEIGRRLLDAPRATPPGQFKQNSSSRQQRCNGST